MSNKDKSLKGNKLLYPENQNKKLFFLIYTNLFAVVALFTFIHFYLNETSLVLLGDGFRQHYKALLYYSRFLKELFTNVFIEHNLVIPQWDFTIGLGSDVITTFTYYSIGDPFALFAAFISEDYILYYYEAMIIARMYLAGAAFCYMCFEFKQRNWYAILTGAIAYVFCSYSMYAGVRHPYFINPMIYLPLIIVGVERIIKGRKPILMAFMVALATLSNFYFFYIIVLLTVIYVVARLICLYHKDIKKALEPLVKIAVASVVGVLMGAVLLLPSVLAFLSDSRATESGSLEFFYPLKHYLYFLGTLITSTRARKWMVLGTVFLSIPAVTALFTQKKKNSLILKVLIGITALFVIFPIFGKISNGFAYVSNRWCFGGVLLICFIIAFVWDKMLLPNRKTWLSITAATVILILNCCFESRMQDENTNVAVAMLLIFYVAVTVAHFVPNKVNTKALQTAVIIMVVINLFANSVYLYTQSGQYYLEEFSSTEGILNPKYYADKDLKKYLKENPDKSFFRCVSGEFEMNSGVDTGLRTTSFYFSLSNGNVSDARDDWNLKDALTYYYRDFDGRTALTALSASKYLRVKDLSTHTIPYGFVPTETENVYINEYSLPLGYTYDSYITRQSYNEYENSLQKQNAMLESVVLERKTDTVGSFAPKGTEHEIDYSIVSNSKHVTMAEDGTFIVTKGGKSVTLEINPVKNCETYLSIEGLTYEGTNPYDLYFGDDSYVDPSGIYDDEKWSKLDEEKREKYLDNKNTWTQKESLILYATGVKTNDDELSKNLKYHTPEFNFYSGKHDYDICFGYEENGIKAIRITFPYIGRYSMDSLKVFVQSMDGYEEKIEALKQDVMTNVKIDTNVVKGKITLDKSKILCLSIPYANGWTAYVDGEEQELLKANLMYCALELDEGEHKIELHYDTPGFKLGLLISVFGWTVFFGAAAYYLIVGKKKIQVERGRES